MLGQIFLLTQKAATSKTRCDQIQENFHRVSRTWTCFWGFVAQYSNNLWEKIAADDTSTPTRNKDPI